MRNFSALIIRSESIHQFKKHAFVLACVVLSVLGMQAQPSMFKSNYPTTPGTSSTGQFASTVRKTQSLYLPGDLTGATPGSITRIYYQYGTGGPQNFTNFTIKIRQTDSTAFNGTTFFTGLTEVFAPASPYALPTTSLVAGDWIEFVLSTPITYDPTKTIIVETNTSAAPTGTVVQTMNTTLAGRKMSSTTAGSPTGTNTSTWSNIGFYVVPSITDDANLTAVGPVNGSTIGTGNIPVEVTIRNFGSATLNDVTVDWTVNGVAQTPVTFNALGLATYADTTVSLGNFNFSSLGYYTVTAASSLPNGVADTQTDNDSASTAFKVCDAFNGNYFINSSALMTSGNTFKSFNEAAEFLNACGVSGPVNFTVQNGPFDETAPVVFGNISGTGPANPIFIDGNNRTINYEGVTGARDVIRFTSAGAKYITLENLNINATGAAFGWGVHITAGANNIAITDCDITISSTSTSANSSAGIVLNGSNTTLETGDDNVDNITLDNNRVTGGLWGIVVSGSATTMTGNVVSNNTVQDFYEHGIFVEESDGSQVFGNEVLRPNAGTAFTASTVTGIYFGSAGTGDNINGRVYNNRIHSLMANALTSNGTIQGIRLNSNDEATLTPGNPNYVYNNLIYNLRNTGPIYGIYENDNINMHIYYNTIAIDDPTAVSTTAHVARGYYHDAENPDVEFKNNIVYVNRPNSTVEKTGIRIQDNAVPRPDVDNNVIYVPGGFVGYWGSAVNQGHSTLAAWQAANSGTMDMNSVNIDPAFTSLTGPGFDLLPTEPAASNFGTPVVITEDFNINTRSATNPDPGAYEWTPTGLDAQIAWVSPSAGLIAPGPVNVVVNILNTSTTPITSINITYTDGVNPVNQTFAVNLNAGDNTDLIFSTPLNAGVYHNLTATINTVNGVADDQSSNNVTSNVIVCQPLSGTYTIDQNGSSSATTFESFNEASIRLGTCGVSGPVVINVEPGSGPYDEQVIFPNTSGASALNTITINGNGETLQFQTTAGSRQLIRLDGAMFYILDSIRVYALSGSTACYAIHLYNTCSGSTVRNCTVDLSNVLGTSSNFNGISSSSSTTSVLAGTTTSNLLIENNTVIGGNYGISLYGISAAQPTSNNIVRNNTLIDYGSRGILMYYTANVTLSGNTITKTATGPSGGTGIYCWFDHAGLLVEKNVLSYLQTTGDFEGIMIRASSAVTPNTIRNNLIHNVNTITGDAVGISLQSGPVRVYHNTVVLDNQSATAGNSFGFLEQSANSGTLLRNNLFYITRAGSGTRAAYSLPSGTNLTTGITANGNAFYIPNGYIANHQTTPATNYSLSAWQSASGHDANSVEADPFFEAGTAKPTSGIINNKGVTGTGVTDDIDDVVRGANPDPGAYEFSPPPNDAAILDHVAACGNPMDVIFVLGNTGTATLTSVTINWTVDGNPQTPYNWTGSLAPGATENVTVGTASISSNASHSFSATSSSPNSSLDGNPANDSFTKLNFRMGLSGAYTINKNVSASATNFVSFTSLADTLAAYGVCGPVVATVTTASGPYTEQAVFTAANGASAVNTITIDGNGEILQATPPDDDNLHILQFNGAAFYTVENLTVRSASTTMGWGIQVTNNSNNITLRDNKVELPDSTTGTLNADFMGIYVGSIADDFTGSACNNIKIQNNEVTGGYRGILVLGTNTVHGQKVTIEGNRVSQFYFKGIVVEDMDSAFVFNNTVTRPTRGGSSSCDMITAGTGSVGFRIYNNVITNVSASVTGTFRGIYVQGATTAPSSGQVYNNLVYGIATAGGSTQNGIENTATGTSLVSFWYNTIVLDGTVASGSGTTNVVYLNPSSGGGTHVFRNNIFYLARQGTGTKTVFNSNVATTTFTSNNNVLYIAAGTPGTLQYGRHSSANIYPTFAAWQGSGRDVNGVSADPMFVNPASNLNPTNTAIANIGFPVTAQVDVDITGANRSNTTPDPGAYEFCGNGEWNGSVSDDWFTAGNWCNNVVPTSTTNVVIPNVSAGSNRFPVIDGPGTAVARDLTIHAGAHINLTAPGGNTPTLEIYGSVTNSGTASLGTGNLTFRGTTQSLNGPLQINGIVSVLTGSTLTTNNNLTIESGGQLLHGVGTTGGGGSVVGNIKIKRNGQGSSIRWNYWGSPVEGAMTNILGTRIYYYDPTSATDPNTTDGLQAGWKSYSGTMAPGIGYISQNGGAVTFNGPVDDLNANINLTAPINAGVVPYNLIGNPFPSAMDAALFMATNGPSGSGVITGSMWFWDDDGTNGSGYSKSDFAAWSGAGGVAGPNNPSKTPNGHVATAQGFNVEKVATGPDVVVFNNGMRSSNNNVFFRQKPIERMWVNVTNTHGLYNEVLVAFIDDATDGYDANYDTKKMRGNPHIALYTKLGGKDYMIQAFSPLAQTGKVVELGIDVGLTGTHTLSLKAMENLDETVIPMLEDRLTGTWQNLRMNPSYSFNVTAAGSIVERFYIHFNAPLEITATNESCSGGDAQIVMNQPGGTLWNYLVVDPQGNLVATDNGFTGSIAFNDLASGDYTIMLSDRDGYQLTKHVGIEGKQMVTADFEASNIAFVNEEISFTNLSNGAMTYDWDFGDGTVLTGVQNPSHTYTEAGTYTVMLRASNADCYHNRYSTIEVSKLSTGIGNLNEDGYNVYSYGKKIFVNLNLDGEKARLQVFDLVGKSVYENQIATKGNYQVDLSRYPDDAYFVIIRTAFETHPVKVMLSGN